MTLCLLAEVLLWWLKWYKNAKCNFISDYYVESFIMQVANQKLKMHC